MSDRPLFWKRDDWRSRWLMGDGNDDLHRIERLDVDPAEWREEVTSGPGQAVCGAEGTFRIPGIFSRMGAPRCERCCDLVGIDHGDGAPGNADDLEEPGCEEPDGGTTVHLPALLSAHLGMSRSEARRIINQGGVKLEGEAVVDFDPPAERISGKTLKVGKSREVTVP